MLTLNLPPEQYTGLKRVRRRRQRRHEKAEECEQAIVAVGWTERTIEKDW